MYFLQVLQYLKSLYIEGGLERFSFFAVCGVK
jgi:hypothetical protein